MSGAFDPYLKWLAILPEEQPANYYRLLGVPLFLDDADVIENAADQRMAHVRNFGGGQHCDLSQRILNEISAAKISLLDPDEKAAYDQQLRLHPPAPATPPIQRTDLPEIDITPHEALTGGRGSQQRHRPTWQQPAMMAIGAALLLLVVVAAAWMLSGNNDQKNQKVVRGLTKSTAKPQPASIAAESTPKERTGAKSQFLFNETSPGESKLSRDPQPRVEPLAAQLRVDINQADWLDLMRLPGIGETLARRIVESREAEGAYANHEELCRVRGIGPRTVEKIKPYLLPPPPGGGVAGP